ncbi:MAG: S1C family serine protease [Lachnospiraceae bacterium]|nr:S1C family serine protease [Lachnospiraceae bacterium]
MTTNNRQINQKTDENAQSEQYSFIKETRKKKPADRMTWIRKILIVAAFSVGAGIIAALVFVLTVPLFQNWLNPTPEVPEVIEVAAASSSVEEEEEEEEEPEPVLTPEDEQEAAIDQYKKVYKGMVEQARNAQKFMVEVIGITSQMDYFNHDYENRQSISGLLVADSQSSVYCLTENRNLKKAEEIQVIFSDGAKATAEFKAADKETNLAILVIKRSDISDATWNNIQIAKFGNSNALRLGTPVIAVGSIMGNGDSIENGIVTSTSNIISLWDASYSVYTTNMISNSLGSGSLVNLNGEVVGIIDQNIVSEDQNVITVLPSMQLSPLIEALINGTPQIRIGIKGLTVSSDISESTGIPRGILVTAVESESPAMYAGIKEFDVITEVAGQPVDSIQAYTRVISALSADNEITVKAMRMGKEVYEEISFQLRPETK